MNHRALPKDGTMVLGRGRTKAICSECEKPISFHKRGHKPQVISTWWSHDPTPKGAKR